MKTLTSELAALERAATILGGQAAVAKVCGYVDRRNVWPWFRRGVPVPALHCPAIELATGGAVKAEELRGGVAWVRIVDSEWPNEAGRPCIDAAKSPARACEFASVDSLEPSNAHGKR